MAHRTGIATENQKGSFRIELHGSILLHHQKQVPGRPLKHVKPKYNISRPWRYTLIVSPFRLCVSSDVIKGCRTRGSALCRFPIWAWVERNSCMYSGSERFRASASTSYCFDTVNARAHMAIYSGLVEKPDVEKSGPRSPKSRC